MFSFIFYSQGSEADIQQTVTNEDTEHRMPHHHLSQEDLDAEPRQTLLSMPSAHQPVRQLSVLALSESEDGRLSIRADSPSLSPSVQQNSFQFSDRLTSSPVHSETDIIQPFLHQHPAKFSLKMPGLQHQLPACSVPQDRRTKTKSEQYELLPPAAFMSVGQGEETDHKKKKMLDRQAGSQIFSDPAEELLYIRNKLAAFQQTKVKLK